MSLIDTYRFSAQPDIRTVIKIVATQPIERKRIEYFRAFVAPRKFAKRLRHFRNTQKKCFFSPMFPARVAYRGPSSYSEVAQAKRAARFEIGLFLRRAATLFAWAALSVIALSTGQFLVKEILDAKRNWFAAYRLIRVLT